MSCPICFSESGKWSDDPILTTPSLSTEEFKGFTIIKPTHIIEIQNSCNLAETEAGLTLTAWTIINNTNIFQVIKTCIKELRTSIENILVVYSKDKYDYFNYDKDGNYMGTTQTEWHDVDLDADLIQIKAIHIEDLRHPIPVPTEAHIIVHAHNPEGKEIGLISGVGNVEIYDGVTFVGYADGITELTIIPGHRLIKVLFNGIEMTQEVDIVASEVATVLTFDFIRTLLDIASILTANESYHDSITHHSSGNWFLSSYWFGSFYHDASIAGGGSATATVDWGLSISSNTVIVTGSASFDLQVYPTWGDYDLSTAGVYWWLSPAITPTDDFTHYFVQQRCPTTSQVGVYYQYSGLPYGYAYIIKPDSTIFNTTIDANRGVDRIIINFPQTHVEGGTVWAPFNINIPMNATYDCFIRYVKVSSIPYADEDMI